MPKCANKQGYTIVEVIIFLAISSLMFVMAASFISGKQSKAEFKDSVFDLNSQIKRVINDVANGYYPSNGNYTCVVDDSAGGALSFTNGSTPQGKHKGCVFLGKALHFNVGGDAAKYNIYSVAGRQYKTSAADGTLPSSFAEAMPVPVNAVIDLTEKNTLKWGTTVSSIKDGTGTSLYGFGFFSSNGTYDNGSLQSGSQTVEIATFPGSGAVPNLNGSIDNTLDSNIQKNPNIRMCLSGGVGEHATIIIGGGTGQRLSTDVKLYGTVTPPGC